jgi:hypothetical protein
LTYIGFEFEFFSGQYFLWFSDESDDDILTVKRADHAIAAADLDDDDELPLPENKAKVITKAAVAKKVMKKKIQSNQVRTYVHISTPQSVFEGRIQSYDHYVQRQHYKLLQRKK